jgi:hypothetical protein
MISTLHQTLGHHFSCLQIATQVEKEFHSFLIDDRKRLHVLSHPTFPSPLSEAAVLGSFG